MLRASTPSHSRWRTPPATRSSAAQTAAPPVSAAAVCQSWPRLGWAWPSMPSPLAAAGLGRDTPQCAGRHVAAGVVLIGAPVMPSPALTRPAPRRPAPPHRRGQRRPAAVCGALCAQRRPGIADGPGFAGGVPSAGGAGGWRRSARPRLRPRPPHPLCGGPGGGRCLPCSLRRWAAAGRHAAGGGRRAAAGRVRRMRRRGGRWICSGRTPAGGRLHSEQPPYQHRLQQLQRKGCGSAERRRRQRPGQPPQVHGATAAACHRPLCPPAHAALVCKGGVHTAQAHPFHHVAHPLPWCAGCVWSRLLTWSGRCCSRPQPPLPCRS